ncbi:uncharacterized protein [Triticum aestivum]|uniref:uncharacterized protein isoform X6 n=1 Tax=Triticum aestivum TaxID=4565 RepID=UPI001D012CE4|nr:uncharacterized protein LOC123156027 isoform X6 [Triticum aestivum]
MLKFKRSKKQLNFLSYMRTLDSGLRRESYCMGNRESFTCKGTEYCHSSVSAASKGHFYCLICSIIELRKFDSFRMSSSELWSSETDGCTAVNKCEEPGSFAKSIQWATEQLSHLSQVLKLGFDEKFIHIWEFYLVYSATGFKS